MLSSVKRLAPAIAALLLAGCGSSPLSLLEPKDQSNRASVPPGAQEYRCEGGKRFFVRFPDDATAWVILPEREFRLDKAGGEGRRFRNKGDAQLDLSGETASLTDGPSVSYTGCRTGKES